MISPARYLLITADDFGIGPETSRGILELAALGAITSTVLLVNSPFAADAVREWEAAGRPIELGWHPCLTLDMPVLPADRIPSLVGPDGRFPGLGRFLRRLAFGRVQAAEVEAELRAQLRRFVELVGGPPTNVNAHHHVHVFRPVSDALIRILTDMPRPFLRRVVEPPGTLRRVKGARLKRWFLSQFGWRAAAQQTTAGLSGNDAVIGITDPACVRDPEFFARWLRAATGQFVELSCHPGRFDESLVGRDGTLTDGAIVRRVWEQEWLRRPAFLDAVRSAGFELVNAAEIIERMADTGWHEPSTPLLALRAREKPTRRTRHRSWSDR